MHRKLSSLLSLVLALAWGLQLVLRCTESPATHAGCLAAREAEGAHAHDGADGSDVSNPADPGQGVGVHHTAHGHRQADADHRAHANGQAHSPHRADANHRADTKSCCGPVGKCPLRVVPQAQAALPAPIFVVLFFGSWDLQVSPSGPALDTSPEGPPKYLRLATLLL